MLCAIDAHVTTSGAAGCRRRFLRYFPGGFADETYLAWERSYKADAAAAWRLQLNRVRFEQLLQAGQYREVASAAIRIESRTNLLFSFEKMALRDAVGTPAGARRFAQDLYQLLHGPTDLGPRDLIDIQSFMWVQGSEEYGGRVFRPVQTTRVKPSRGIVAPTVA